MTFVNEVVTYNQSGSATTVVSPAMAAAPAGSTIWALVACAAVTTTTATLADNASGNTYTLVDSLFQTTQGWKVFSFKGINIQNSPTTWTATFNASRATRTILVDNYSGLGDIDSTGAHAIGFANAVGTGANAVTSGSYTTTQNGCTVVASYWNYDGGFANPGTGFTLRTTLGLAYATEDLVQATAGSTAGTFTANGATDHIWVASMAFAPATAAAACNSLSLLGVGCGIWAAKKVEQNPVLLRRKLILPLRLK